MDSRKLRDEAKLDYSTTLVAKLHIMKKSPWHSGVVDSTEAFLDENLDEKSIAQILRESCDLRQEQVGIIQNVLTAPKHLHYFSSELHTGTCTSNYYHSMLFIYF